MINRLIFLWRHDLAVSFKNRSVFLLIFLPVLIFASLKLIDDPKSYPKNLQIGMIIGHGYPALVLESLSTAHGIMSVKWFADEGGGIAALEKGSIDGVVSVAPEVAGSMSLLVLKRESFTTLSVLEAFAALQKIAEGNRPSWINEIKSLNTTGVLQQSMPTWVLMLVLLVGVIVIPAQVAEEKEKGHLLGLLSTPMREWEWVVAKIGMGLTLITGSVFFLHIISSQPVKNWVGYSAIVIAGGFCFCALGIVLGFMCRTQASARAIGIAFYLPNLLPSALSEFSNKMYSVAGVMPSFRLYQPVKFYLLGGIEPTFIIPSEIYLSGIGILASMIGVAMIKKRWLM